VRPAALLKTFPARWAFIPFKPRLKDQCSQLRRERKQLLRATPVANGSARELESRRRLTHRRTGPGWTWSGEKSLFQRFIPVWPATFGSAAGRTREHAVALSRRKGITSPLLPFMGQQVGSSALARRGISLRGTQSSPERAVRTPQSLSVPHNHSPHPRNHSPRAAGPLTVRRNHPAQRGITLRTAGSSCIGNLSRRRGNRALAAGRSTARPPRRRWFPLQRSSCRQAHRHRRHEFRAERRLAPVADQSRLMPSAAKTLRQIQRAAWHRTGPAADPPAADPGRLSTRLAPPPGKQCGHPAKGSRFGLPALPGSRVSQTGGRGSLV